jgi:hypothetical protein
MDIQKTIPVQFKSLGRFLHPDGVRSWHNHGYVCDENTGDRLGVGMLIRTQKENFALNQKDFYYASRPGSKCEYLCFINPRTGTQLAITMKKAIEIVREIDRTRGVFDPHIPEPYYLIYIDELTGEKPVNLF